ncbi:Protein-glutamine gamma-glutamyltransferase K [Holothuria leucospilota]|uniref:Protein-glutamine gamma-glutamyltransferase K n=1 Tax=Holothuria leucospilota TaxID=206669 RepID=A0A9Q1BQY7_HOLLE|nr:Protein-glutamine gamma-glutamyltransferase K [Holothuria leucospilota]
MGRFCRPRRPGCSPRFGFGFGCRRPCNRPFFGFGGGLGLFGGFGGHHGHHGPSHHGFGSRPGHGSDSSDEERGGGHRGPFHGFYGFGSMLANLIGRRYDINGHFIEKPIIPEAPPAKDGQLGVETVDFKTEENRKNHRTNSYEVNDLILRRGQDFKITLKFTRPFNKSEDVIGVEFRTGSHPVANEGTLTVAKLVQKFDKRQFGFMIESVNGREVTLVVRTAANAIVGEHQFDIITHVKKNGKQEKQYRRELDTNVYLLFNPWCKDDTVYMEDDAERKEYVLSDSGYIWYGTATYLSKRPWNFGQFDAEVFECVINLMEKNLKERSRRSPVTVSRVMSAAVNVQDDEGVLAGRWDGKYSDGIKPTAWKGSVAILEQYLKTKKPVKYGQCWVFSGVLTTVLRCLGIPARSVTNFASAHDTDRSVTIDHCVDENNRPIPELNGDSVWNFHVWNDCWMARPDLPIGYGGWQAVDSTPQETSDGMYQTGPCSLNAVKQGQIYLLYDAPFVFAEVNADRVYWKCKKKLGDWDMKVIRVEQSAVGKFISTKAVGSSARHDITNEYKYPEGTNEERFAVRKAVKHGDKPEIVMDEVKQQDVTYSFANQDVLNLGNNFDVRINLTNKGREKRSISMTVTLQVCYYTGVLADVIKEEKQEHVLSPGQSKTAVIKVSVAEYLDKLVEQSQFKVSLMGMIEETKQLIAAQDDFRLETPDLNVKLLTSGQLQMGKEIKVALSFQNPLHRVLTGCTFTIEGAGLTKPLMEKFRDVKSGEFVRHELSFLPFNPGRKTILANFDCDQFENVNGTLDVDISWAK